jgi:hypothetical protein
MANDTQTPLDPFAPVNPEGHQDLAELRKILGTRIIIGESCAVVFSWADYTQLGPRQWPHALPPTHDVIDGLTEGPARPGVRQYSIAMQEWVTPVDLRWATHYRFAQLFALGVNDPDRLSGPARFASTKAARSEWSQRTMAELRRITLRTEDEDLPISPEESSRWSWLDELCATQWGTPHGDERLDLVICGTPPPAHSWHATECTKRVHMRRQYWDAAKLNDRSFHQIYEKGRQRLYPVKLGKVRAWLNALRTDPSNALRPDALYPSTDPTR